MALPGLSLSILRQSSTVKAGEGLLISGRCTLFGLGVPAFIRVQVEGPSYNPDIRTFSTVSAPFTGNYNVSILADKDGEYDVYAQAFAIPALPTGTPLFPEDFAIGPTLAESTRPPIVVGELTDQGVRADIDGKTQLIQTPQLTPIEVSVAAPVTSIQLGSYGGESPIAGFPSVDQVQVPVVSPSTTPVTSAQNSLKAGDLSVSPSISPNQITQGNSGLLSVNLGNVSPVSQTVNTQLSLEGPGQLPVATLPVSAFASGNTPLSQRFTVPSSLPSGTYGLRTRITSADGALLLDRVSPNLLQVLPLEIPTSSFPEAEIPQLEEELPIPSMTDFQIQPVNIPATEAGKRITGSAVIPYTGPVLPQATRIAIRLYGVSQTGITTGENKTVQFPLFTGDLNPPSPGSALTMPFNTIIPSNAVPGVWDLKLNVFYSGKDIISNRDIGDFVVLEKPALTTSVLPSLELPGAPDFNFSSVNLNLSGEQGKSLSSPVSIPYSGPSVPLIVTLNSVFSGSVPSGSTRSFSLAQKNISAGQPISFSFTKLIPSNAAAGRSDIIATIMANNQIVASQDIGNLNILEKIISAAKEVIPTSPSTIPELPQLTSFPGLGLSPSVTQLSQGETFGSRLSAPKYTGPNLTSPVNMVVSLQNRVTRKKVIIDTVNLTLQNGQAVNFNVSEKIDATRFQAGSYDVLLDMTYLGKSIINSRDIGDLNVLAGGITLPGGQTANPTQVLVSIQSIYRQLQSANSTSSAIAARTALAKAKSSLPSVVYSPLSTAANKLVYVNTYAQPYAYNASHPSGWPSIDNLPSGFKGETYIRTGAGFLNKLASLTLAEKLVQIAVPPGFAVDDIKGTANGVDVKFHLSAGKGYQLPSLNSITSLVPQLKLPV